jgi:hypothetical protein
VEEDPQEGQVIEDFENAADDQWPCLQTSSEQPRNWRGRPLESRAAVVEPIAATTTKTGLKVECMLDTRTYLKGIKVSDEEMATLDILATSSTLNGTTRLIRDCAPQNSSSCFCASP